MGESLVQVTEGTGKKLHTWQKTVGANSVEDEFVIPGEYPLPSYIVSPAAAVSCANAGDDVFQLMAGASLNLRIRRVRVEQAGLITSAAGANFRLARVTTAGTGGTAITPAKLDNSDSAAGATAASGVPTATSGTLGSQFFIRQFDPVQTAPTGGVAPSGPFWEWTSARDGKPIIIPAGTANGLVVRNISARAGLTVNFEVEFVETSF